jgi:hypothetical protein
VPGSAWAGFEGEKLTWGGLLLGVMGPARADHLAAAVAAAAALVVSVRLHATWRA